MIRCIDGFNDNYFTRHEEVYKPDDPDLKGLAEVVIGKQRNGEIGEVQLTFRGEYCQFLNREFRQFERING